MTSYRGDISAVVNSDADIIKSYDYEAFGSLKNASAADDNPFRYCGEYFDDETGFVYLRNRYYDPSIGRFTTEDPAKSGLNWYAYCENNPVKYIDPWGLRNIVAIVGSDYSSNDNVFNDDIIQFKNEHPEDTVITFKSWEYKSWRDIKNSIKQEIGDNGIDALIIAAHSNIGGIVLSNDYNRPGRPNIGIDKYTSWRGIPFNKNANIKLMGCNAGGMAGHKNMKTIIKNDSNGDFISYTGEIVEYKSIAQIIANKTGATVWAFTNYTSQDSTFHQVPTNRHNEVGMTFSYTTGALWWKRTGEKIGYINGEYTKFERQ